MTWNVRPSAPRRPRRRRPDNRAHRRDRRHRQARVREAAADLARHLPRIDVLINNAGRYGSTYEQTPDGFESHLSINYLAPFLLTHLLLPTLKAAPAARVVNVAGETARIATIRMNDLNRSWSFSVLGAYGQSKLAFILFTSVLAEALDGTPMLVNALQPGMAATEHLAAGPGWLDRLWRTIAPDPDIAARAVATLALEPDREGTNGRYYFGRLRAPAPCAWQPGLARTLYLHTAKLVALPPELQLLPGEAS